MKNLPFVPAAKPLPQALQLALAFVVGGLAFFLIPLLMLPYQVAQEWLLNLAGKGADKAIDFAVFVIAPAVGIPSMLFLGRLFHRSLIAADALIIKIDAAQSAPALLAGQAQQALSDGSDMFIVTEKYSETGAQVDARRQIAVEQYGDNCNIICIAFGMHTGMIRYKDGESVTFDRNLPPQANEETAKDFSRETWPEYNDYLREFRASWPAYSVIRESRNAGDSEKAAELWAKRLRLGMACFALLFAANFATAQTKSVELRKYLGERCEMPAPAGEVFFRYEGVTISRKNDAKKPLTFSQLLASSPAFTDSDAGKLQKVYTRTNVFAPQPAAPEPPAQQPAPVAQQQRTGAPAYDPVRPYGADGQPNPAFMLPDSASLALTIDESKEKITGWKAKLWQMAKPVWGLFMWIFNSILALLVCFGGLCRYVAKTAAQETVMTTYGRVIVGRWIIAAHENAAAMLIVVTWVIVIVMLIDIFMWLVWLKITLWLLVLIWFPILWIAEKLTNWIVPNVPMVGGSYPAKV